MISDNEIKEALKKAFLEVFSLPESVCNHLPYRFNAERWSIEVMVKKGGIVFSLIKDWGPTSRVVLKASNCKNREEIYEKAKFIFRELKEDAIRYVAYSTWATESCRRIAKVCEEVNGGTV